MEIDLMNIVVKSLYSFWVCFTTSFTVSAFLHTGLKMWKNRKSKR